MSDLRKAALVAVRDCMGAAAGENVLVIMDKGTRSVGMALFEAAVSLGCEAMVVEIIPRKRNGEEPPQPVAELMRHVDVVLAPTSKSITHTVARGNACKAGVRVATLPGITEDCMARTLVADYDGVAERAEKYARLLSDGKNVRITNAEGTDISMSLEGRTGMADTGIYRARGSSGNLPAGEAFIAPVEGTANGVFVVDGAMAGTKFAGTKIKINVVDGYAVSIEGGEAAKAIEDMIGPLGMPARNIAELGIGTNDHARITGQVLEDEKVMGTIHIALGDNSNFGGNVRVASHLDGIVVAPTVEVDGVVIMDSGKFIH
ncbi:MAG: aminopeptidase [Bacillota bacterium]|jgi:aminopeptidase|nr:aminopeptidase [Bacillota bacterium]NLH87196.1 aminopeptidase [Bacillota bacterium]HAN86737.1 leucyl aminopeptidase [Bacillota bacterium]